VAAVELERCIQLQQVLRVQFRCLRVARALMAAMAAALAAFGILAGLRSVGRCQPERCYLRLVIYCGTGSTHADLGSPCFLSLYRPRCSHHPIFASWAGTPGSCSSSRGSGTSACLEHVEGNPRASWGPARLGKENLAKQNAYSRHGNGNITNARVSFRVWPQSI
jgi:hypothetical protein